MKRPAAPKAHGKSANRPEDMSRTDSNFVLPAATLSAARARAALFGQSLDSVLGSLMAALSLGEIALRAPVPAIYHQARILPPSETISMAGDAHADYLALLTSRQITGLAGAEDAHTELVWDKVLPAPRFKCPWKWPKLPAGLVRASFSIGGRSEVDCRGIANKIGASLNDVAAALLAMYAEKRADVLVCAVPAVPPTPIKSRPEMRKMSNAEWGDYMRTLTPEQSEELWRRDDGSYMAPEVSLATARRYHKSHFSSRPIAWEEFKARRPKVFGKKAKRDGGAG